MDFSTAKLDQSTSGDGMQYHAWCRASNPPPPLSPLPLGPYSLVLQSMFVIVRAVDFYHERRRVENAKSHVVAEAVMLFRDVKYLGLGNSKTFETWLD